ncbi:MAG: hypothetical protein NVSMB57_00540 [Actinomycetota bacterium]
MTIEAPRWAVGLNGSRERIVCFFSEHWLISAFIAIGASLRIVALAAVHPALLFYGDSFSYINNAAHLHPGQIRPIGYPVFLRLLGLPGASLFRVVVVQHLLGLALGIALYLLCRRLTLAPWVAALAAAPILLDGYQVNIEHFVMAETVFDALVVGALLLLTWRTKPKTWVCGIAGVLMAFATLTRAAGIALIVVAGAYAVMRRFGWVRVLALTAAFAIPLVGYATWFQATNKRLALTSKDGSFLYARVAPFASCPDLILPAYERQLCDLRPPASRPDTNYYIWGLGTPKLNGLPKDMDQQTVLADFAKRVMTQQTDTFTRVVVGDLVHFFAPGRTTRVKDFAVNHWQWATAGNDARRVDRAVALTGPPAQTPRMHRGPVAFLAAYQKLGYMWGPVLLLTILLGLAGSIGISGERSLRWESLLFALGALAMLVVPLITAMFDYRYVLPALPLAGPAAAIGGTVLARRLRPMLAAKAVTSAPSPIRMPAPVGIVEHNV